MLHRVLGGSSRSSSSSGTWETVVGGLMDALAHKCATSPLR